MIPISRRLSSGLGVRSIVWVPAMIPNPCLLANNPSIDVEKVLRDFPLEQLDE
jgi:hypothetical protein